MKTFLNYITDIEELQQNLMCIKEDKTNKTKYFFNTILFFTNERDSSKNKTLKKLEEAVEDTNINIIPLVAEEVHYVVKNDKILINDDKTFKSVVFPLPVPPEINMLYLLLTSFSKKCAASSVIDPSSINRSIVNGLS